MLPTPASPSASDVSAPTSFPDILSFFSTSFSPSADPVPTPSAHEEITAAGLAKSTAQQVAIEDQSQLQKSSSEPMKSEIVAPALADEGEGGCEKSPASDSEGKASGVGSILLLVLFYTACILGCLYYSFKNCKDVASAMPWVGRSNATSIVMERLKTIEIDFENSHLSNEWRVVPNAGNITVEMLDTDSLDWPTYVRVSTVLKIKPAKMYEFFQGDNLPSADRPQPFYQSLNVLFSAGTKSSAVDVVRKVRSYHMGMIIAMLSSEIKKISCLQMYFIP